MNNNTSANRLSIIALVISAITLLLGYIKPQFIDKPELELSSIKQLRIGYSFGAIQIHKSIGVVNLGNKAAVINKIECFLIFDKKNEILHLDEPFYIVAQDYLTNDRRPRFSQLNGFTIWPNNGFSTDIAYTSHKDQDDFSIYQEVRDSLQKEINCYNNVRNGEMLPRAVEINTNILQGSSPFAPTGYKISSILEEKIKELQIPFERIINNGTYFLCERITLSNEESITKIYTFQLTDREVKELKTLVPEIIKLRDIETSQFVTVDIQQASSEDCQRVLEKLKKYDVEK